MGGLVSVNCGGVPAPTVLSFQTAAVLVFLCLLTISGNLLVLYIIIADPVKKFKTPFYFLLCNLASTDLMVGLVVEPTFIFVHVREGLEIPFAYPVLVNHMMYFIPSTASVFGIASLVLDRYLAVTSPLKYKFRLSSKRAVVASAIIWTASISVSCLYFLTGFINYSFVFIHVAVFSTLVFYIFVYVSVYAKLKKQSRLTARDDEETETRTSNRREEKITKTFLVMLLAFVFCYGPSCVMIYMMNMCTQCSCTTIHWFRDWSMMSVVLNSAVNPFVYSFSLPHFKESIKRALCCFQHRVFPMMPVGSSQDRTPQVTRIVVGSSARSTVDELISL